MDRRNSLANYIHPICVRLWQIRRSKRISLKILAKKTGYTINTISTWERGIYIPNIIDLDNWAQALNREITFKLEVNLQSLIRTRSDVQPLNPLRYHHNLDISV